MFRALIALLGLLPAFLLAADGAVNVETKPSTKLQYPWITRLVEGPAGWIAKNERAKVQGKTLRFVHYDGPEEAPAHFRVEEVTFGTEGCCRTLLRAREFEIAEPMLKAFGPFDGKAGLEFEFVKWLSPTALEFKYFGGRYVIYDLEKAIVKIRRNKDGS